MFRKTNVDLSRGRILIVSYHVIVYLPINNYTHRFILLYSRLMNFEENIPTSQLFPFTEELTAIKFVLK